MPFRLSLPRGPASRMIGGEPASGPVMEGVGRAVGASAGAAGAAGAAGVAAGVVACGGSAGLGAGASCAKLAHASPTQRATAAKFLRHIVLILSAKPQYGRRPAVQMLSCSAKPRADAGQENPPSVSQDQQETVVLRNRWRI